MAARALVLLLGQLAVAVHAQPVPCTEQLNGGISDFAVERRSVYHDATFEVIYQGGTAVLAGTQDGTGGLAIDDALIVTVTRPDGSEAVFSHDFSNRCSAIRATGPFGLDVFQPGRNRVRVQFRDLCGGSGSATGLWLVFEARGCTSGGPLAYAQDGTLHLIWEGTPAPKVLPTAATAGNPRAPALAPDWESVAYVATSTQTRNNELRLVDLRTSLDRVLVEAPGEADIGSASFAADGQRLLFTMGRREGPMAIHVVDTATTAVRRLTRSRLRDERDPTASEDGRVAFSSRGRLYTMDMDGKSRTRVTRRSELFAIADQPVFAEEGSTIVFRGRQCESCPGRILSVGVDGKGVAPLTSAADDASRPVVAAGGRRLAFVTPDAIRVKSTDHGLPGLRDNRGADAMTLHGATDPSFSVASAAAPSGCFGTNTVDACFRPYQAIRDTALRTAPDPGAPEVVHDGVTARVSAGKHFGRLSDRNAECSNSPQNYPARSGFIYGYVVHEAGNVVPGKGGWVLAADLYEDPLYPRNLCGPAGEDFDCRIPGSCGPHCDGRGVGQLDSAGGIGTVIHDEYLRWAADSTTFDWLSRADKVRRLGKKSSADAPPGWTCVEVVSASFAGKNGQRGWVKSSALALCGNGSRDDPEECDDGNGRDCDGCSALCRAERCGNGRKECSEECDDGNSTNGDGCDSNCTASRCGNRIVTGAEQCEPYAVNCPDAQNQLCLLNCQCQQVFPCDLSCCDGADPAPFIQAPSVQQCQHLVDSSGFDQCRDNGGWATITANGQQLARGCPGRCGIECCRYSASPTLFRSSGPGACMGNMICESRGTTKRNVFWVPDGGIGQHIYGPACPSS